MKGNYLVVIFSVAFAFLLSDYYALAHAFTDDDEIQRRCGWSCQIDTLTNECSCECGTGFFPHLFPLDLSANIFLLFIYHK